MSSEHVEHMSCEMTCIFWSVSKFNMWGLQAWESLVHSSVQGSFQAVHSLLSCCASHIEVHTGRIVGLYENGADLRLVSRPGDQTIRVALTRLRRCPEEIGDPSCPATEAECLAPSVESENSRDDPPEVAEQDETPSVWRGRLRPREKPSEDACDKDRDM